MATKKIEISEEAMEIFATEAALSKRSAQKQIEFVLEQHAANVFEKSREIELFSTKELLDAMFFGCAIGQEGLTVNQIADVLTEKSNKLYEEKITLKLAK